MREMLAEQVHDPKMVVHGTLEVIHQLGCEVNRKVKVFLPRMIIAEDSPILGRHGLHVRDGFLRRASAGSERFKNLLSATVMGRPIAVISTRETVCFGKKSTQEWFGNRGMGRVFLGKKEDEGGDEVGVEILPPLSFGNDANSKTIHGHREVMTLQTTDLDARVQTCRFKRIDGQRFVVDFPYELNTQFRRPAIPHS